MHLYWTQIINKTKGLMIKSKTFNRLISDSGTKNNEPPTNMMLSALPPH